MLNDTAARLCCVSGRNGRFSVIPGSESPDESPLCRPADGWSPLAYATGSSAGSQASSSEREMPTGRSENT